MDELRRRAALTIYPDVLAAADRARRAERQARAVTRRDRQAPAKPAAVIPTATDVALDQAIAFFARRERTYEALANAVSPYLDRSGTVLDVGANIGYFVTTLERVLGFRGTAHLFEPVEHLAGLSEQYLASAGFAWTVYRVGLGDADVETEIHISANGNLGWNTLVSEQAQPDMRRQPVSIRRFDGLGIEERPSLIKIDVEGAEYRVLQGLLPSLEKWDPKPVILCEIGWGCHHPAWEEEVAMFRALEQIGYRTLNLAGEPVEVSNIDRTTDVLFVPSSVPN
ncbi:FkbM family methyltransferase [Sporichthya brevicatena]|uniref:FkbM family methyltransferase n=1 Tax=Sporichthya brevicatena TaxID=171442 RepID=UPI0031D3A1FF